MPTTPEPTHSPLCYTIDADAWDHIAVTVEQLGTTPAVRYQANQLAMAHDAMQQHTSSANRLLAYMRSIHPKQRSQS